MFARIGRAWRALKEFYLFALPIRFSFLALGVLLFAFIVSAQGADILRALAEDVAPGTRWRLFALLFLANILAYAIWYASRYMLRYRPHLNDAQPLDRYTARPKPAEAPRATQWTPRWLGLFVFIILLVGLARVGYEYSQTHGSMPARVWWAVGWLVVTGALYFWLVRNRRRLMKIDTNEMYETFVSWSDLVRNARPVLIVTIILEIIIFAIAFANPVFFRYLGTAAVVVLTIMIWVPLGSAVVALGEYLRFPVLGALIVWAFLVSPLTDNHQVRPLGDAKPPVRRDLRTALVQWHQRVRKLHPAGGRIPLILVATEGGGIRAAYWTSSVLSSLQMQIPSFADHCFAISSVSGGSLGATVFNSLLARRLELAKAPADPLQPLAPYLEQVKESRTLQQETHAMLGFDALSGTLASMAQPDLAQRFIPLACLLPFPDRAKALEQGWEAGWRHTFGTEFFTGGFLATMQRHPGLPVLLLNGTVVETGDRIITSNVALRPDLNFRNAYDAFNELGTDLRLSTAANMSARFTYVGPAGTIRNIHNGVKRKNFGHVVDGGYFENSGAVTAAEVIGAVNDLRKTPGGDFDDVDPLVIIIDFYDSTVQKPSDPTLFCPSYGLCGPPPPPRSDKFANEVLAPLRALLNTRSARGAQAVGDVAQLQRASLVEFRLVARNVPLPLGWVLSDSAMAAIDNAMGSEGGNVSAVALIRDRIAGAPPAAVEPCLRSGCGTVVKEKEPGT
ncbi:MAG: hypothetical protein JWO56_2363 [Acidobacteria bacterium]|nr:hypothetical protein [Acidobacteriota bacterium]